MSEKFMKGDRVRVVKVMTPGDLENGLKIGTTGVVTVLMSDKRVAVKFDDFKPTTRVHVLADGYVMGWEQLELVKDETGEPGCPPAASPAHVLTNAELQSAIDRTHELRMATGNPEAVRMLNDHLGGLLKIQLARASQEPAA